MDVTFVGDHGVATTRTMVAKSSGESRQPLVSSEQTVHTHGKQSQKGKRINKYLVTMAVILTYMLGELIGTFLLTLVICSAVGGAVLSGSLVGIWQVGVVCGMGVAISIYCVSHISEAHLNPAVTIAFAIMRYSSFSWKKIVPYITAQMMGGILAGAVFYSFNSEAISLYEEQNEIQRGENSSILTAMLFGEYFPNPALYNHSDPKNLKVTSLLSAFAVETWTTSILTFVIFSLTNKHNTSVGRENKVLAPLMIGLTVSVMISIYGQHTQVGMNPARDLGPRIVAACAGWGVVAIPGPRGGFWVYIVGPVVGAVLGAVLSSMVVAMVKKKVEGRT